MSAGYFTDAQQDNTMENVTEGPIYKRRLIHGELQSRGQLERPV